VYVEIGLSPRPLVDWRLETPQMPSDFGGVEKSVSVLLLVTIIGSGVKDLKGAAAWLAEIETRAPEGHPYQQWSPEHLTLQSQRSSGTACWYLLSSA
jgi:hypothetical protein